MKRTLFALALAAALPMSAQASELSYSYVELDYGWMNVDDGPLDIDPTGWGIKGSVSVSDSWYLFGGYQQGNDTLDNFVDTDSPPDGVADDVDVDMDQTQIGIGWRHAISDRADFDGELSYIHQTVDIGENIPLPAQPCGCSGGPGFIPNSGFDSDGYRLSGGLRGELAKNFEGWVKANWTDGSDFSGDFSGTVGAQVKFGGMWGVTGEAEFGNDANIYTLGVRASF
jgi:hypothetical protein